VGWKGKKRKVRHAEGKTVLFTPERKGQTDWKGGEGGRRRRTWVADVKTAVQEKRQRLLLIQGQRNEYVQQEGRI